MSQIPPNSVIFYADGPGFVEVESLPHSGISTVTLVRQSRHSATTTDLHVRKTTNSSDTGDTADETHEVTIAMHLCIRGAYNSAELSGWACYQNTISSNNKVHVSYWKWCNSGTMRDLIECYREARMRIPETALWYIFQTMFRTIRSFHEVGVAHKDAHDKNWIFHLSQPEHVRPEIRLVDYGEAHLEPVSPHSDSWLYSCRLDYYMIYEIFRDLSSTATHARPPARVRRYGNDIRSVIELLRMIDPNNGQPQHPWQYVVEQVNELLNSKTVGRRTMSNAWRQVNIRSLRRPRGSDLTNRSLAAALESYIEDRREQPEKFWCAEVVNSSTPHTPMVLNITHPPKEFRTTYKNVTDMTNLPEYWVDLQREMAAKYQIDPFEDPEDISYEVANPGRIDNAV